MKIYLFTILAFFISISCSAQECFRWLGDAQGGQLFNVEGTLKIKLKVLGIVPDDAQFDVLTDGTSIYKYQKSNLSPILTQDNVLTAWVPVRQEGVTNITVSMKLAGKKCVSKVLTVNNSHPPRLYILTIGPTPYNIQYTNNDANDMHEAFLLQDCGKNSLYADVIAHNIVDDEAEYTDIRGAFNAMIKDNDIRSSDVFVLFISSHGNMWNDEFYIQPDDFDGSDPKGSSIKFRDFTDSLDNIAAKKLIFLDACESGGAKGGNPGSIKDHISTILSTKTGYTIITSSSENELSYYNEMWENGAFTEALLEGLSGQADYDSDGVITTGEIYSYLESRVPELGEQIGKIQHPNIVKDDLGDFPFFKTDQFCMSKIKGRSNYYPTVYIRRDNCLINSFKKVQCREAEAATQEKIPTGGFHMGKYEVTNQQYCDFLNNINEEEMTIRKWLSFDRNNNIFRNNGKFKSVSGRGNQPVVNVSYYGAVKYAEWLSGKNCKFQYSLPSVKQWESAACQAINFYPNNYYAKCENSLLDVDSTLPNSNGIHGMSGNVAEWCRNTYPDLTYAKEIRGRDKKKHHNRKMDRKQRFEPDEKIRYVGFRLVKMDKSQENKCK